MTSATRPQLNFIAAGIFNAVIEAMQNAEEIGGPEPDEYVALMDAIIAECATRRTTCLDRYARRALALMYEVPDDSFGTVDAVRALDGYDAWSGDYREQVVIRLRELITKGD